MSPPLTREARVAALDAFHAEVSATILSKQNAVTGLIPASTAVTIHGNYTDAWVRDNVYSIYAVYALALAYRKVDDDSGKGFELEKSVVKCLRGLLGAMMKQSHKVQKFKNTQHPLDALHAKYSTTTGDTVVGDADWGHLQLDATGIFLLLLAQTTMSGLEVVYTLDEVDFVQNLTYYLERAYRTPDYGLWERGNKINHGTPELNSSSIGCALAGLEAINGVNLFGARGGPASVIRVLDDEVARNRVTLEAALPRESSSKEVDAALLSAISFPSFSLSDPELLDRTRNEIISKLQGHYGLRRFLRDGHQTAVEDVSRIYYDPHELRVFEAIESEWPLFYTYLVLDGLFLEDRERAEEYRKRLEAVAVDYNTTGYDPHDKIDSSAITPLAAPSGTASTQPGFKLLPELYFVPADKVDLERANPGSQPRVPNANIPLVWAQSLWITSRLLMENLVSTADLDPLGRRFMSRRPRPDTVVQIVLVAESADLQSRLRTVGVETQTLQELGSVSVRGPGGLRDALKVLGMNPKLGLTGRPSRPVGVLSTSKLYRIEGNLYAFLPSFLDRDEFYVAADPDYIADLIEVQLNFLKNHWHAAGRPTVTMFLTDSVVNRFRSSTLSQSGRRNVLSLLAEAKTGRVGDVRVRLGRMQEMVGTSCIESLDFLSRRLGSPEDWRRVLSGKADFDAEVPKEKLQVNLMQTIRSRKRSGPMTTFKLKSPRGSVDAGQPATSPLLGTPGSLGVPAALPTAGIITPNTNLAELSAPGTNYFAAKPLPTSGSEDNLATPGGMLQTPIHGWRLKEHNTSALEDMEYTPNELSTLDLDVNDPSRVDEAIAVLKETTSLFDQCDLLQYLKAVRGADFGIEGAGGTADELLNEVYKKSVRLGLWNVARQAAGLLRKSPNGLSYHVIDLLVRGLPISVGRGASEYSISSTGRGMKEQADAPSSLNSDTLRDLVLDHASEPREGPVLFEIIVALADASRSQPALFEGVARLRISLIYDAMVREIGRTYGVPAQEANERLMILSPTELRHLLRRLLETHESRVVQRTVTPIHIRTEKLEKSGLLKPESELAAENGAVPTVEDGPAPVMSPNTRVSKLPKKMQVIARSAGEASGNFASVDVLVDGEPKSLPDTLVVAPFSRGLVVVVIDSTLGLITFGGLFDTHASSAEAEDLGAFLEDLREGEIVALACKDDCSEHLDVKVKEVIARKLGSKAVHSIGFRDSWCLVATLGEPESCRESHVPAAERNPAGPVVLAVDMAEARERIDFLQLADKESFCTSKSLAMIAPTLGECYRKRAVDGALNRVPNNGFYKKVWDLLHLCKGLSLAPPNGPAKTLWRDPLVSEKTAEEANFAMMVEIWLDAVEDPASRTVVMELLMALELPEGKGDEVIELLGIVRTAIETHWKVWSSTFVTEGGASQDIASHASLATSIFEDLPEEEAARYLREAAVSMGVGKS